jgi:DNA-directed RNA polymerase subunit RPC12/RpoP
MTISMCGEKMMVGRCMTCGIKYRYRFIFGEFGFRCKGCREKMEMKGEV